MPITITQTDTDFNTADQSSYTHTALNIGSGGGERAIIVDFGCRNAITATVNVTVDGEAATTLLLALRTNTGSNLCGKAIIQASDLPDPDVEDVDVVVDYGVSAARHAISISVMTGHDSITPFHTVKAEISADGAAGPLNIPLPINVPEGGAIHCVAGAADNVTSSTSFTWTNASEQTDFQTVAENYRLSTAWSTGLSAETARAVNASFTGGSAGFSPVGVAVSFEVGGDVDGDLASVGAGAASFTASAVADGVLGSAGASTVTWNTDGTLVVAGAAVATFSGALDASASLGVAGAGDAAFVGLNSEGILVSAGAAVGLWSSLQPADGEFLDLASSEALFLGELGTRWTSSSAVISTWTAEGGVV